MTEGVHSSRVIRFGIFEVDLQSGELRKAGLKLKLTGQPFQVLAAWYFRPITPFACNRADWQSGLHASLLDASRPVQAFLSSGSPLLG